MKIRLLLTPVIDHLCLRVVIFAAVKNLVKVHLISSKFHMLIINMYSIVAEINSINK